MLSKQATAKQAKTQSNVRAITATLMGGIIKKKKVTKRNESSIRGRKKNINAEMMKATIKR